MKSIIIKKFQNMLGSVHTHKEQPFHEEELLFANRMFFSPPNPWGEA